MKKLLYFSFVLTGLLIQSLSFACTSLIVSSKATVSGRPIMLKNRDTGNLDNRIEYFNGEKYSFIGLVNSDSKGGEVWGGTNSVGLSIMNTASYNIKNDDISYDNMDKEGNVMYEVLGTCATLEDFEKYLSNHSRPLCVEANFGLIDAYGGAAYYEVNNYEWIKYDVNDPSVAPKGYRVVTNFSESGRKEDYEGWERYLTASSIIEEIFSSSNKVEISHSEIMNLFARSYRHEFMGIDCGICYPESGIAVDQDFIPRRMTSATMVFEGVKNGENPIHTIMWTSIGYPSCSVMLPYFVGDSDRLPSFVKNSGDNDNCEICDFSGKIKKEKIFCYRVSNGKNYFNIKNALMMVQKCRRVEDYVNVSFENIFKKWVSGDIEDSSFYKSYEKLIPSFYTSYVAEFSEND